MDDGRCHICRRVPLRQSSLYRIATCDDCNETRRQLVRRSVPGIMLRALRASVEVIHKAIR